MNPESRRLEEARDPRTPWKKWGPYLSERQWGTVREDYSGDGNAWDYFSHDQARSRAYHWGEDGLAGISDDRQRLCFALALWNGKDPILKERLFGLTNGEGNHGEDVKECYFYLDSTPTHSYMKYLYKYPQAAYPYDEIVGTNRGRSRGEPEYDVLQLPDGHAQRLKVRSMVGLLPLCAVTVFEGEFRKKYPDLMTRFQAFLDARPELVTFIHDPGKVGQGGRRLGAILDEKKLRRVLAKMLDENEFLGAHGIRSLSRYHAQHPYSFRVGDREYEVPYLPGESDTGMFGGNSNWRGPIWMPVNALIIRALLQYYTYYGNEFTVECPTGSGRRMNLYQVAEEISRRLAGLFLKGKDGRRPVNGGARKFQEDPHWRDLIQFYEYFHGDTGAGLGASHQTGWTGVIARAMYLFATTTAEQVLELGKTAAVVEVDPARQPPAPKTSRPGPGR